MRAAAPSAFTCLVEQGIDPGSPVQSCGTVMVFSGSQMIQTCCPSVRAGMSRSRAISFHDVPATSSKQVAIAPENTRCRK